MLAHLEADGRVAIASDDRRLGTVADGLGATVPGTIGVVVSVVEEGVAEDEAKTVVRRVDEHGLHMTAELRTEAEKLIETAAD